MVNLVVKCRDATVSIKHKFHILEDVSNTNKTENERKSPPIYLVIFIDFCSTFNVKFKKKKRERALINVWYSEYMYLLYNQSYLLC